MKVFDMMRKAKENRELFGRHFYTHYLLFFLLIAGAHALAIAVLPLASMARGTETELSSWQQVVRIVYTLFQAVAVPLLTFGIYRVYLIFAGEQRPAVSVLFDGFSNPIRAWLLFLMKSLMVFFGTLVFILPGIFFFYNTAMVYFVFSEDEDMAPWHAISESARLMKGNRLRLFRLQLCFLGWFLLVVATLGLALIYVGPYYMNTLAVFYRQIKNEKTGD